MYRLLFLLTAFLPGSGIGQIVSTGNFNSEDTWKKTRLISVLPAQPFTASDTAIIVVSNRKQTDDTLRFMSEHREASALSVISRKPSPAGYCATRTVPLLH
mgnify:CR=1 FL=1